MLHNPSTADAEKDDPTSRRGVYFATKFGAARMTFVNPFAGRATHPIDLWKMDDPIGPDNMRVIQTVVDEVAASKGFFIFAWGAISPPKILRAGVEAHLNDVEMLVRIRCDIQCLGRTQEGHPRHPLYLSNNAICMPWAKPHPARKDF